MTTRVHILGKELGVTSKAILEKCRAEGLDVKNHMSTLSAGLEATIREWFSEDTATHTAIEVAEAVDLKKVRRKPRKKKIEAAPAVAEEAVAEPPPVEAEEPEPAEAAPTEVAEPPPVEAEPVEPVEPVVEVAEPAVEAAPPAEIAPPAEAEAPAEPAEPEVAEEPKVEIKPGPQNVPAPAELKGPRVIRVERPEPVSRPRPRGPRPPEGSRSTIGPSAAPPTAAGGRAGVKGRRGAAGPAEPGAEEGEGAAGKGRGKRRGRSPRRSGRVEVGERIREWRDQDLIEREERLAQATGRLKTRRSDVGHGQLISSRPTDVTVQMPITVKDLSSEIGVKATDIIRKLMSDGAMVTMNQVLDGESAVKVAAEFGVALHVLAEKSPLEKIRERFEAMERTAPSPRPPVVTFLGHVDHGKTSLLDRIRHANVVAGEAGGITQHIGAYRYESGNTRVVFLDTPGHEAFTAMRARGAHMTDVVVLVVAADDGVMPQTVEAINHAKAAGVPIVVALNKIDRPDANVDKALGQLAEHDLSPREWGGSTEVVKTSATSGQGVDDLLELLGLEAELLELKADPTLPASGSIIEAQMDVGRGVVARALVQEGTLRVGDVLVCGPAYGRVKALVNDRGQDVPEATPATPVEISGLSAVPEPGEKFYVLGDLSEAKDVAEAREAQLRESELVRRQAVTLENLFSRISAGETKDLPLIVKADVQGSVDVLIEQIGKLGTEEVKVSILHAAVGGVSESDVLLAAASDAIIIGFHVVPDERARGLAAERGVQIRLYKVIYEITDAIRKALEGMLSPEIQEKVLGHAEVRETFKVSRLGTVAGCYVNDGILQRSAKIRLTRDGVVVQDALTLDSLRRFKDDAREVRAGLECGLKLTGYDDIKVGDRLEAWTTQEVARTLD